MFHVKRESLVNQSETMFHVKQIRPRLLPDAELAEDDVQDVLDVDPAKQTAE